MGLIEFYKNRKKEMQEDIRLYKKQINLGNALYRVLTSQIKKYPESDTVLILRQPSTIEENSTVTISSFSIDDLVISGSKVEHPNIKPLYEVSINMLRRGEEIYIFDYIKGDSYTLPIAYYKNVYKGLVETIKEVQHDIKIKIKGKITK